MKVNPSAHEDYRDPAPVAIGHDIARSVVIDARAPDDAPPRRAVGRARTIPRGSV